LQVRDQRLLRALQLQGTPQTEQTEPGPLPLELPPLYPAQQRIRAEAARFNVLDIGRRAGKTYIGAYLAKETVSTGAPCGWFAPNYKYLLEVWQQMARDLRPWATKINATERRIELGNGAVLEFWTLDGGDDPGRSRKYQRAIIDEAAIAPNLKAAWEEAIRATLTDLEGDAWFLSTPKGLNYFHDLFIRGQDRIRYPEWRSWQMPSSVNPFLPAAEIEAAARELPEMTFRQEYLAQFLQSEGAVFRAIDVNLTAPVSRPHDHEGHMIVVGVDWGRAHDFTAASGVCCHCEREVFLDRFNQIGWDLQRARILSLCERWKVQTLVVETNSIGGPNLEALQLVAPEYLTVLGFETTAKSKPPLIQALALALEKRAIAWLPDPVGRHELAAYEARITAHGNTQYSAPDGGWDDTVIARALAWKLARGRIPVPLSRQEQIEQGVPDRLQAGQMPVERRTEGWEMARARALAESEAAVDRAGRGEFENFWHDTV
jgi:hypothetical protein